MTYPVSLNYHPSSSGHFNSLHEGAYIEHTSHFTECLSSVKVSNGLIRIFQDARIRLPPSDSGPISQQTSGASELSISFENFEIHSMWLRHVVCRHPRIIDNQQQTEGADNGNRHSTRPRGETRGREQRKGSSGVVRGHNSAGRQLEPAEAAEGSRARATHVAQTAL
jgi:hypothetical protein